MSYMISFLRILFSQPSSNTSHYFNHLADYLSWKDASSFVAHIPLQLLSNTLPIGGLNKTFSLVGHVLFPIPVISSILPGKYQTEHIIWAICCSYSFIQHIPQLSSKPVTIKSLNVADWPHWSSVQVDNYTAYHKDKNQTYLLLREQISFIS